MKHEQNKPLISIFFFFRSSKGKNGNDTTSYSRKLRLPFPFIFRTVISSFLSFFLFKKKVKFLRHFLDLYHLEDFFFFFLAHQSSLSIFFFFNYYITSRYFFLYLFAKQCQLCLLKSICDFLT